MAAEEAVLLHQRRALVRQALATLPLAERTALVLRDLEGHSTEEVAHILGVRPVTIRSQVASARAKVQAFCARLLKPTDGGRP
jgi:RNA polymerase sigma-70 factor (ECF subfamily)